MRRKITTTSPQPKNPLSRTDGWQSAITGLGTKRDKTQTGHFVDGFRIGDPELTAMFLGEVTAAKCVEFRPREMMRRGYEVQMSGKKPAAKQLKAFADYAERLDLNAQVLEGMIWGRLYGGAVLLIGAQDGRNFAKPLDEDKIKTISYLNMIDRRYLVANTYYNDPLSPKYNQVETYMITNSNGGGISLVHETRLIRFDGHQVDIQKRRELAGWTLSVLQRPYDTLRTFGTTFQAVSNLVTDFSQGVWKITGLMEMIASGEVEKLQTRMAVDDMMRSTGRSVMLDKELEEFNRVATPLAGLPEVIDRLMMWLSGALDIPVSILFGRSAAGMNATGEMDFRAFYDTVASEQTSKLLGPLLRLYRLISKAKDFGCRCDATKVGIHFLPLFEPTTLEQAQTEKTVAEKDAIYLDRKVLTAEEVALSRYADGGFSMSTNIDVEARLKAQSEAVTFKPYENEPPPENTPPGEPEGENQAAAGAPARAARTP